MKASSSNSSHGNGANQTDLEMSEMADEVEIDRTQTLTFDTRMRRVKMSDQTPGSHEVTFSVSIAMAIKEATEEELGFRNHTDHRMSAIDVPKALSCFHMEYKISPDDSEVMKTDVIFFGTGGKVYPDRSDARAVKVWFNGNKTWISWIQNFKIHVNDHFLKSLCNYQLTIKVWDTRDKCGTKARFDKPKGFRFPAAQLGQDPDSIGGVKSCVLKLCKYLDKSPTAKTGIGRSLGQAELSKAASPPPNVEEHSRERVESSLKPSSAPKGQEVPDIPTIENYAVYALSRSGQQPANLSFDRLTRLAGPIEAEPIERFRLPSGGRASKASVSKTKSSASNSAKQQAKALRLSPQPTEASGVDISQETCRRSVVEVSRMGRGRKGRAIDPEQEIYDKQGRFSITVNMAHLFSRSSIIEHLPEALPSIEDMFVSVNLDEPLLSDIQKSTLNPLIIRIKSAKDMPSTPLNYYELEQRSEAAYCQYEFFNLPMHRTVGKLQGQQIVWNDVQVILTGLTDIDQLKECLGGPPVVIEVHDRDKRPVKETLSAALFGDDLEDEKICNIGVVTAKRTAHSAFGGQQKAWDSFGIAKVSTNELLRGPTIISLTVPITQCSNPDVLGVEKTRDGKVTGVSGAVDGPTEQPLPNGHFIESNSSLTVSLEVFHSLLNKSGFEKQVAQNGSCPFGRIIFISDASNFAFIDSVNKVIKRLNASTLGIDHSPDHVISTSLHNYKLNPAQMSDGNFNLITGFHAFDGMTHMFVLEGPKDGCVRSIWYSLGRDLIRRDDVRVLYNDNYAFRKRLYFDLDVDIGQITIHDFLENITQQPLLYVRDIVPKDCFQGISRFRELSISQTLESVISNDFLPNSSMVKAVSREFGLPVSFSGDKSNDISIQMGGHIPGASNSTKYVSVSRWTKRLDNFNESYLHTIHQRKVEEGSVDHMQANITRVRQASVKVHQQRVQSCPAFKVRIPDQVGFNYSNQGLNSSLKAREIVRQQCNPQKRYTYSHRFLHSATMEPINVEEALRAESTKSKARWRTAQGWVFPGVKSDLDSNLHPKLPSEARRESITQPWKENQLHAAVLKPTLEGRENYPANQHAKDFDLYTPAKGIFINEPHSIMSTGVEKDRESADNGKKIFQQWSRSLVVDDPRFRIHRVLPETELCIAGPKSANQIDCLQSMRKDPPKKYGLVNPGYQDIPALRVLSLDPPETSGNYTVDNSEHGDLRKNFVPCKDVTRGFKPIFHSREVVTLHKIVPLNSSERKNNLFYKRPPTECV